MKRNPGYALATVLILLGVAMFLGGAIVTVSTLESKISASQKEGINAYYIAESGVEDGLWKLKNNAMCGGTSCLTQLQNNSLNYSYSINNAPLTNQSFTVTYASTAAGAATITSIGRSATGLFTAQRKIVSTILYGATATSLSNTAVASGNILKVTNGGTQLSISGGDMYATSAITLSQASVSNGGGCFLSPGPYSGNSATCIRASNYAPAANTMTIPSYVFSSAGSTYSFIEGSTANQSGSFEYAVEHGQNNFNGYVYISGSVSLNNKMNNRNVTINGRLVVDGSLITSNALNGMNITLNDQGAGHNGMFINGALTIQGGQWNINGVMYANGAMILNNSSQITINGALISNSDISISTHAQLSIAYTASRVSSAFSSSQPSVLQVKHWEESY